MQTEVMGVVMGVVSAKIIFSENIRIFMCIDFSDQNFMLILIAIGKNASVEEKKELWAWSWVWSWAMVSEFFSKSKLFELQDFVFPLET